MQEFYDRKVNFELDDFKKLSKKEYKQIRSTRLKQLMIWQIIPNWIWIIIASIGCILILKESTSWWLKTLGIIFISYSSLQIGSRIWKVDDFMNGYQEGLSHGVEKTLNEQEQSQEYNNSEQNEQLTTDRHEQDEKKESSH